MAAAGAIRLYHTTDKPRQKPCTARALWTACIGDALQKDKCLTAITGAGLKVVTLRENPQYRFLTASAQKTCATYGVKSVSLLAVKS